MATKKKSIAQLEVESQESQRLARAVDAYYKNVTNLARHYIPINQDLLILYRLPDVPLFVEIVGPSGRLEYKSIRSRGQYLSQVELDGYFRSGFKDVFIERADAPRFTEYIESVLSELQVESPMADEKKVMALRTSAITVMSELFEEPSPENIQRGIKAVSGFVHMLMSDPKAYKLLLTLSSHDAYTLQHSVGVSTNAIIVAKKIGINDEITLIEIGVGGLLHDLGKTKVGREIINKQGPLTKDEWDDMKKHPLYGYEIIKDNPNIGTHAKLAVLQHHEDANGTGYPIGLSHDQVDLFAKIVTLCDIYNAVTTDRSYSKARAPFDAFQLIKDKLSHKVDAKLFEAMVLIYGGKI